MNANGRGNPALEQEQPERVIHHAEAPASATIKVMVNDFETLFTMRSDDYNQLFNEVADFTGWLKDNGYKAPPARTFGGGPKGPPPVAVPADGSAPICPTHKRAMKKGQYGWMCSAKLEDGSWCKQKAK